MTRDSIGLWSKIADPRDPQSFSARYRKKRLAYFKRLIDSIERPLKILDVGGTEKFWISLGLSGGTDTEILLLNVKHKKIQGVNVRSVVGDGCNLTAYRDNEFDVVFSNSVIEHVGGFERQQQMAQEIMRVGKRYFVETPNYYFPLEPHFLVFGFQYLPISFRTFLVQHFSLGWFDRLKDKEQAKKEVESIRLLKYGEIKALFPEGMVRRERFCGWTKSFVVYGGWG